MSQTDYESSELTRAKLKQAFGREQPSTAKRMRQRPNGSSLLSLTSSTVECVMGNAA